MSSPYETNPFPLKLIDLLPPFYKAYDDPAKELERFLDILEGKLDEVYRDQQVVSVLQDPMWTREDFLVWIARSLEWSYISEDTESQRHEALEIANFHDLKGTPYALRLLAGLTFKEHFDRLAEYYVGQNHSISTIREKWKDADPHLKELLEGDGMFALPEWHEQALSDRGRAYAFDKTKRLHEYFTHIEVDLDTYVKGDIREAFLRYLEHYEKFHPAGRWNYIYISTPQLGGNLQIGVDLIEELVGGRYYDSLWEFDTGVLYDEPYDPVHPSISYHFPHAYEPYDIGELFDTGWNYDEGDSQANALIELG